MTDKAQLFQFLFDKCKEDYDLLEDILTDYVSGLSDSKLDELQDFMVNNFGED